MKPLIYQYRMQWRELLQCVGVVPDNIFHGTCVWNSFEKTGDMASSI